MSLILFVEKVLLEIGATDIELRQRGAGGGRIGATFKRQGKQHRVVFVVPNNRKVKNGSSPPQARP